MICVLQYLFKHLLHKYLKDRLFFMQYEDIMDRIQLKFRTPVPKTYYCVFHKDILMVLTEEITMLPCGHRACKKCLHIFLKNNPSGAFCPGDDESCSEFKLTKDSQYMRDKATERDILRMDVYCMYKGCDVVIKLKDLKKHLGICEFQDVYCQYCNKKIPKIEVGTHRNNCNEKLQVCPFSEYGCEFCGDLKQHKCQEIGRLLLKLNELFKGLREEFNVTILDKDANTQGKSIVSSLKNQCSLLFSKIGNVKMFLKKLEQFIDENINLIQKLNGSSNDKVIVTTTQLYKLILSNEERLKALEQHQPISVADVQRKVTEIQNQTRNNDTNLIYITLRMDELECASYDGKLIWRIPNYSFRWDDAKSGRRAAIYSAPFYTDEAGIKIVLRLYPEGDGAGRGTHMSLFMCIMRGTYDAVNAWPFRKTVRFTLLNQDDRQKNIQEGFIPDINSSSFRKPVTDMNVASGCPLFVPHSVLRTNPGFTKDNMIFIKCVIQN